MKNFRNMIIIIVMLIFGISLIALSLLILNLFISIIE